MAGKPTVIAKAIAEDGETVVELMSDGRYRVSRGLTRTEKAKLFPAPASRRPDADDGPPKDTSRARLFRPGPQGKRMPNGLWNSSVPLPGHDILYAEAEVKRR